MLLTGVLRPETLGSLWGKDETTGFQNDAVRDDLRLGAEEKQVLDNWEESGLRGGRPEGPRLSPRTSLLRGSCAGTGSERGGRKPARLHPPLRVIAR